MSRHPNFLSRGVNSMSASDAGSMVVAAAAVIVVIKYAAKLPAYWRGKNRTKASPACSGGFVTTPASDRRRG
jgi:hypothetical protein